MYNFITDSWFLQSSKILIYHFCVMRVAFLYYVRVGGFRADSPNVHNINEIGVS